MRYLLFLLLFGPFSTLMAKKAQLGIIAIILGSTCLIFKSICMCSLGPSITSIPYLAILRKYIFYLIIFNFRCNPIDNLQKQLWIDSFVTLISFGLSLYVGGLIGSIHQLSWIAEGTTLFQNTSIIL